MVRLETALKKFLLGVVLLGATSSVALAADLPSRRAPPVYIPPPIPVFTWTGSYIGINAGYAFDAQTQPGLGKTNGFTGGGQIGYNQQIGNFPLLGSFAGAAGGGLVFGVEADAAYTDLHKDLFLGALNYHSRTDFVGTARGRVGVAFGELLVYGTGGFAYGGVNNSFGNYSDDKIRKGYAYGGGIEYAIPTSSFVNVFHSSAVTLKAEYLHYDLGRNGNFNGPSKVDGNLVRGGINYKLDLFGAPGAPVVARY